jgi:Na+-translocating ferredoxin:NAD+ oxidoreductase RnfD subunit
MGGEEISVSSPITAVHLVRIVEMALVSSAVTAARHAFGGVDAAILAVVLVQILVVFISFEDGRLRPMVPEEKFLRVTTFFMPRQRSGHDFLLQDEELVTS